MATVLYINAHPLNEEQFFSLQLGKAFLHSYREEAPDDEIQHLNLYQMEIPYIDADVFAGWGKLRSGSEFAQLGPEEQRKVHRLGELCDQFVAADRYIFVTPLWNFMFPPILKAYIDALCVTGKTFRYTEAGPEGLLTAKKALHIQARGGIYSEGPAAEMEFGHRYLAAIMRFFGVPSFDHLFVEGHNQATDRAQEILAEAIMRTPEVAKRFAAPLEVEVRA